MDKIEVIRRRPGMYTGGVVDTHLWSVVNHSFDEYFAGHARTLRVGVERDDTLIVEDDGDGCLAIRDSGGESTLSRRLDVLGGDDMAGPPRHGERDGHSLLPVTALSLFVDATLARGGREYHIRYEDGYLVRPFREVGPASRTGMRFAFRPNPAFFDGKRPDVEEIVMRLNEIASLFSGITVELNVRSCVLMPPDGLHRMVPRGPHRLIRRPPVSLQGRGTEANVTVEITASLLESYRNAHVRTFVNGTETPEGGIHRAGFARAFVAAAAGEGRSPDGRRVMAHVSGAVHVLCPDPAFKGSFRTQLVGPREIGDLVERVTADALRRLAEEAPETVAKWKESFTPEEEPFPGVG